MATLNNFELALKAYLDKRAKEDKLFAKTYKKENKTIEKCAIYIIEEVKKKTFSMNGGKMAALPDAEVYGMAVHYYDEDDLDIDKKTPEEMEEASESVSRVEVKTPTQGSVGKEIDLFG